MAGKRVLITGVSRGRGLAMANWFIERGNHVAGCARSSAAPEGWDTETFPYASVDLSDDRAVQRWAAGLLEHFGTPDLLINNAGVADFGPIEDTSFDRWRTVMETNLDGVFLMTQAFTPALAAAKGAIVNIASISGLRASTLRVAYGTSKAGVIALTQQQAVELGEHGIRANCVCPGPVRTKLAMAVHTQDIIDAYHDAIPLNRYGSETEIAEVIAFLCSDKASYVTGQVIAADGGFDSTGVGLPALRED